MCTNGFSDSRPNSHCTHCRHRAVNGDEIFSLWQEEEIEKHQDPSVEEEVLGDVEESENITRSFFLSDWMQSAEKPIKRRKKLVLTLPLLISQ